MSELQQTTLGGGCFWCLEAVYQELRGVTSVVSGYSGGQVVNPTYEQVCSKTTGHAEVVQLTFDPSVISYKEILEVFFTIHDPTTPNRQGNDVGPQYRSVIFYHDEAQKQTAKEVMAQFEQEKIWNAPLVTQLVPLEAFYKAEDYHQNYFRTHPNTGYCAMIIQPKVAKFRKKFLEKLKQ
jgi:peptide-methionine (S)-S-oxide reductase